MHSCEKETPLPDSIDGALKSALVDDYDFSEAIPVYGPLKVERTKSKPKALTNEIQITDYDCYESVFLVEISSGELDGKHSVSSGIVIINDEVILSQKDFKNKALFFSLPMELPENFNIEVRLNGKPGDFLTIEIKGIMICTECGGTFIDERDGREYRTVQIGDQCWMAENLAYLPSVGPSENSYEEAHYYVYGYFGTNIDQAKATENYKTYGVLYNWPAAIEACPSGWHLPSNDEWWQLVHHIGAGPSSGRVLKSITGWDQGNPGTDLFGFTALPAGTSNGRYFGFIGLGFRASWWLSNISNSNQYRAHRFYLTDQDRIYENELPMSYGLSVRCIKDE